MALLTEEDLQMIPEPQQSSIRRMIHDVEAGLKTRDELVGAFTKIYSNPEAKDLMEQVNEKAGLGLKIPKSPVEAYVAPIKKELEGLKAEKQQKYDEETKQLVQEKFREYNIPWNKETADKIDAYRLSHAIMDSREGYLSSVELYAKEVEMEPVVADYQKPFDFKTIPDENAAYTASLKDIKDLRKISFGRRS